MLRRKQSVFATACRFNFDQIFIEGNIQDSHLASSPQSYKQNPGIPDLADYGWFKPPSRSETSCFTYGAQLTPIMAAY